VSVFPVESRWASTGLVCFGSVLSSLEKMSWIELVDHGIIWGSP